MNPSEALEKYRHIVVVNSERISHEMDHAMRQLPEHEQTQLMGGSDKAGYFWLFRDARHPGMVLEIVYSEEAQDSISSIYKDDSFNASLGEVIKAREELIQALSDKVGLSAEAIGINDEARGRDLAPKELTTGQLIDMLAEQMGTSIITPDNAASNDGLMARMLGKLRR